MDTNQNHKEAFELAQLKHTESNLARCYLGLRELLRAARDDVERGLWSIYDAERRNLLDRIDAALAAGGREE